MQSYTEALRPVNGQQRSKTVIGTVTVTEPFERKIGYETASWYTMVEVPAGTYEIYLLNEHGPKWAIIGYEGIVTKEHFVNRVFWASSVHEPTENIGKQRSCSAQTYPYVIAESFALDPRYELAEDWSIGSEERSYSDGRPYTAYHLIDPNGNTVR